MDTSNLDTALTAYCRFFETLDGASLERIQTLFEPDALFVDPFNRVRGAAAIRRIFEHLLRHWPETRFRVVESCRDGQRAYLRWTFQPQSSRALTIEGVSRVEFAADGRIASHRDYWDSASELYARLPGIGPPMRWLLRRSQAEPHDQLEGRETPQQPTCGRPGGDT